MIRTSTLLLVFAVAAGLASAQTVTRKGSVSTLDVATWNVEQFQTADPQMANVVSVMQQSGIDLWALQEVTAPSVITELLARLGNDWDARVSTTTNLYTAFVYRKDVISVRTARPMFSNSDFDYEYAGRRPYVMEANVTLPDTTLQVMFVTLHMKCCSDTTSWQRRKDAATALKNRLDFLHASDEVMVLGDWNDETDRSITFGRDTPFRSLVDDPDYQFLLPDNVPTFCGNSSSCTSGSTIDNVMISDELYADLVPGSTDRFDELLQELSQYSRTSDHLPVFARFSFSTPTGTELPSRAPELELWPLPATGQVWLNLDIPARVVVTDLLGRVVLEREAHMPGRMSIDVSQLSTGVYAVSVLSENGARKRLMPLK
ncbi:MAG: endonuclease/exonuclease/phosphatase family protein [Rhodothermales bacterium]|nr:endonuclease/exonuclease/phosphatase family protein [Rhodothermales bacterium]